MGKNQLISICQLNCQSLRTVRRKLLLEEALGRIRFDIVGLSETWLEGVGQESFTRSGHSLFWSGGLEKRRGTGFVVAQHLLQFVEHFQPINDRCCFLDIRINRQRLRVVQVYAPTGDAPNAVYHQFLSNVQQQCRPRGQVRMIICGDFNAAVGRRAHDQEPFIGRYGYGARNARGELLVDYCCANGWSVANTYTKQRSVRKWTWRSPTGWLAEYDLFLCRGIRDVRSVHVIKTFDYPSDHRLVRMELELRRRGVRKTAKKEKTRVNWPLYVTAVQANKDQMTESQNAEQQYASMSEVLNNAKNIATEQQQMDQRISDTTRRLFAERRKLLNRNDALSRISVVTLNKAIRISLSSDIERRLIQRYQKTLASRQIFERITEPVMWRLQKEDGSLTKTATETLDRIRTFYNHLYAKSVAVQPITTPLQSAIPPVLDEEVRKQLRRMKSRTAPGHDSISTMMIRSVEDDLIPVLSRLFSNVFADRSVPSCFADAVTTLIPKKGDLTDVGNYRPISVLPSPFKLLTRVLLARIHASLEAQQPPEQAGFRRGFSTVEHLHTIHQLINKAHEFNMQLYLVFVDYKKAYDSVEWQAVWNALVRHDVDPSYIELLRNIYESARSKVKVNRDMVDVDIERGVRQGCVLSPALFNCVLEDVFRSLDWDNVGVNINGQMLNHLRYADDVVLVARSLPTLQRMLNELNDASLAVGLEISKKKTVAMGNLRNGRLFLRGQQVDFVDHFTYLGASITCTEENKELGRRIGSGWAAFNRHRTFLTRKTVPMKMKRKVFHTCIMPSLTYGAEVWSLNAEERRRLSSVQRRMERAMVNVTLWDRVRSEDIRAATGLKDVLEMIWRRKSAWAFRMARLENNRWSKIVTEWIPMEQKRRRGRPRERWQDDLAERMRASGLPGPSWMTLARNGTKDQWNQTMSMARP